MIVAKHLRDTRVRLDDPDVAYDVDTQGVVTREGGAPLTNEDVAMLRACPTYSYVAEADEVVAAEPAPVEPEVEPEEESLGGDAEEDGLDPQLVASRINDFYVRDLKRALDHFEVEYESSDLKSDLVDALAAHITSESLLSEAVSVLGGDE